MGWCQYRAFGFLSSELVQGNVVLDVFRDELPVFRGHGLKFPRREDRVRGQIGQMAGLNDVPDLVTGGVSLEVSLDGRNSLGLIRLVVSDKF